MSPLEEKGVSQSYTCNWRLLTWYMQDNGMTRRKRDLLCCKRKEMIRASHKDDEKFNR